MTGRASGPKMLTAPAKSQLTIRHRPRKRGVWRKNHIMWLNLLCWLCSTIFLYVTPISAAAPLYKSVCVVDTQQLLRYVPQNYMYKYRHFKMYTFTTHWRKSELPKEPKQGPEFAKHVATLTLSCKLWHRQVSFPQYIQIALPTGSKTEVQIPWKCDMQ